MVARSTKIRFWFLLLTFMVIISSFSTLSLGADTQSISTKTRKELMIDYVKSLKNDNGFYIDTSNHTIAIDATYFGISLSDFLRVEYSIYDIIYFIQSLQDSNYGFSNTLTENTSLDATYYAVQSLLRLGLSAETLKGWRIFEYANNTIAPILYNSSRYSSLSVQEIDNIRLFLELSVMLNITVIFPYNALIDALKNLQYTNGTYQSFNVALHSLKLLHLLNQQPRDITGAINFINAFRFNNTGFSSYQDDNIITITDTYNAIKVLKLLGENISFKQRIIDSILKFQHTNGGFAETETSESTSLKYTYYAYLILLELDGLDQLDQLAFLASTGYLDGFTVPIAILLLAMLGIATLLQRKHPN